MPASSVERKAPPFLLRSRTRAAGEDRECAAGSAETMARVSTELRRGRRADDPAKQSAELVAERLRRSLSRRTCSPDRPSTSPQLPTDSDDGGTAARVSLRAMTAARRRRDYADRIARGRSGALRSHGAAWRSDPPARPTPT